MGWKGSISSACLPKLGRKYWLHNLRHYNRRSYLGKDHSIVMLLVAFDRSFQRETDYRRRIQDQVRCSRRKGGREEHRMDWAGLGVLGDGSMMACGGSGDGGIL